MGVAVSSAPMRSPQTIPLDWARLERQLEARNRAAAPTGAPPARVVYSWPDEPEPSWDDTTDVTTVVDVNAL